MARKGTSYFPSVLHLILVVYKDTVNNCFLWKLGSDKSWEAGEGQDHQASNSLRDRQNCEVLPGAQYQGGSILHLGRAYSAEANCCQQIRPAFQKLKGARSTFCSYHCTVSMCGGAALSLSRSSSFGGPGALCLGALWNAGGWNSHPDPFPLPDWRAKRKQRTMWKRLQARPEKIYM